MNRSIELYGQTFVAPEGITVSDWVEAATNDPAMDEVTIRFIWVLAQAFASAGIE